jgi:hypothetical protein
MNERTAIVLLICTVIGVLLWMRGSGASARPEARLLRICRGNQEQAERLIQGELDRSPGIARAEAAARAIERYKRDNR